MDAETLVSVIHFYIYISLVCLGYQTSSVQNSLPLLGPRLLHTKYPEPRVMFSCTRLHLRLVYCTTACTTKQLQIVDLETRFPPSKPFSWGYRILVFLKLCIQSATQLKIASIPPLHAEQHAWKCITACGASVIQSLSSTFSSEKSNMNTNWSHPLWNDSLCKQTHGGNRIILFSRRS